MSEVSDSDAESQTLRVSRFFVIGHQAETSPVRVDDPRARATLGAGATNAVYLTLTDQGPAGRLFRVNTPVAGTAALHETMNDFGVMTMRAISGIALETGKPVILAPDAPPLATVDTAVDLPASTAQKQARPDAPVFLTIKADRTLTLGDVPVTGKTLPAALAMTSGGDKDQRVFLHADKTVDYDTLTQLMNVLRSAGFLKIALVGLDQASAR